MTPDYAALDAGRAWLFKNAWDVDVKEAGFSYITEMVDKTYKRLGTTTATAKELGVSPGNVGHILHYIGTKMKPRGGRNYTVLNADLVRELRIGWDGVGTKKEYISRFMREHELTCHFDTVKMALDGRTWGCV